MNKSKKGFTMVELSLAIIFIAILILSIGYLTIHITSTYEKGLAMKAVNATGKELIDDFSRAIAASPARTVASMCGDVYKTNSEAYKQCVNDKARKMIYQQHYGIVKVKEEEVTVPIGGVFCTGRYTYIWNTAYALNKEDYPPTSQGTDFVSRYIDKNGNVKHENFRLLKVTDFSRNFCKQHLNDKAYLYNSNKEYVLGGGLDYDLPEPEIEEEMLDNSENNLALYDMTIFSPTVHGLTSSGFYSGTFILATLRGGINIFTEGEFCSDPPDNLNTDFAYCAINKFNFAMRANGEKLRGE